MSTHLTATEAASLLGISVPTLYAYVSRGMLHSSPDAHGKHRLYDGAEVRRLARRKADGKRAGKVAQKVLDWGVPVLESSITLIADGRLLYRGRNAVELARTASLEEVAALLWECSPRRLTEAAPAPLGVAQWSAWLKLWSDSTPLDRALVLLPAAAAQMPRVWAQGRDAQLDTACAVMRLLAAALISAAPSNEPLHRQLAAAWGIRNRQQIGVLRAALVACADHELNASTFTVRCITSTGTHLFGAVGAASRRYRDRVTAASRYAPPRCSTKLPVRLISIAFWPPVSTRVRMAFTARCYRASGIRCIQTAIHVRAFCWIC
jgi:citrate synthase